MFSSSNEFKAAARRLSKACGAKLGRAQEVLAKALGYRHFDEAMKRIDADAPVPLNPTHLAELATALGVEAATVTMALSPADTSNSLFLRASQRIAAYEKDLEARAKFECDDVLGWNRPWTEKISDEITVYGGYHPEAPDLGMKALLAVGVMRDAKGVAAVVDIARLCTTAQKAGAGIVMAADLFDDGLVATARQIARGNSRQIDGAKPKIDVRTVEPLVLREITVRSDVRRQGIGRRLLTETAEAINRRVKRHVPLILDEGYFQFHYGVHPASDEFVGFRTILDNWLRDVSIGGVSPIIIQSQTESFEGTLRALADSMRDPTGGAQREGQAATIEAAYGSLLRKLKAPHHQGPRFDLKDILERASASPMAIANMAIGSASMLIGDVSSSAVAPLMTEMLGVLSDRCLTPMLITSQSDLGGDVESILHADQTVDASVLGSLQDRCDALNLTPMESIIDFWARISPTLRQDLLKILIKLSDENLKANRLSVFEEEADSIPLKLAETSTVMTFPLFDMVKSLVEPIVRATRSDAACHFETLMQTSVEDEEDAEEAMAQVRSVMHAARNVERLMGERWLPDDEHKQFVLKAERGSGATATVPFLAHNRRKIGGILSGEHLNQFRCDIALLIRYCNDMLPDSLGFWDPDADPFENVPIEWYYLIQRDLFGVFASARLEQVLDIGIQADGQLDALNAARRYAAAYVEMIASEEPSEFAA